MASAFSRRLTSKLFTATLVSRVPNCSHFTNSYSNTITTALSVISGKLTSELLYFTSQHHHVTARPTSISHSAPSVNISPICHFHNPRSTDDFTTKFNPVPAPHLFSFQTLKHFSTQDQDIEGPADEEDRELTFKVQEEMTKAVKLIKQADTAIVVYGVAHLGLFAVLQPYGLTLSGFSYWCCNVASIVLHLLHTKTRPVSHFTQCC